MLQACFIDIKACFLSLVHSEAGHALLSGHGRGTLGEAHVLLHLLERTDDSLWHYTSEGMHSPKKSSRVGSLQIKKITKEYKARKQNIQVADKDKSLSSESSHLEPPSLAAGQQ